MYMAICDEVINKRQAQIKNDCARAIFEYENLPFWKQLFTPSPDAEVMARWEVYQVWMNKRIARKSKESLDQLNRS